MAVGEPLTLGNQWVVSSVRSMNHRDMCPAHLARDGHIATERRDGGRPAENHRFTTDHGAGEPEPDRLRRNWNEILQELRVTQTGSQIITGFLLTLPFAQRFADLDTFQIGVYLVLVVLAAVTTIMSLTPVSLHRTLFRRGAKDELVGVGNSILKIVLVGVAAVLAGTVLLIFDVVVGRTAGFIAGALLLVLMITTAVALPAVSSRLGVSPGQRGRDDGGPGS